MVSSDSDYHPSPPLSSSPVGEPSTVRVDRFVLEVYAGVNFLLEHFLGRVPRRRLIEFGVAYANMLLDKVRLVANGKHGSPPSLAVGSDALVYVKWTKQSGDIDAHMIAEPLGLSMHELQSLLPHYGVMILFGDGFTHAAHLADESNMLTASGNGNGLHVLFERDTYADDERLQHWLRPDNYNLAHVHIIHERLADGKHKQVCARPRATIAHSPPYAQYFALRSANDNPRMQMCVAEFAQLRFGAEKAYRTGEQQSPQHYS